MANAKKNQKAAANEVAAEITTAVAAEVAQTKEAATTESGSSLNQTQTGEGIIFALEDRVAEAKKRERGYSQSAIDKGDLERLNGLKAFVKEKLNVTISNQRIIAAALDCLGDNVESFLKSITDEINAKNTEKERKTYEALKAKFEAMEAPAAAAQAE